jgi:hypothetical protein
VAGVWTPPAARGVDRVEGQLVVEQDLVDQIFPFFRGPVDHAGGIPMDAKRRQRLGYIGETRVNRNPDPVFVIAQLDQVGMKPAVSEENVLPQQDRVRSPMKL